MPRRDHIKRDSEANQVYNRELTTAGKSAVDGARHVSKRDGLSLDQLSHKLSRGSCSLQGCELTHDCVEAGTQVGVIADNRTWRKRYGIRWYSIGWRREWHGRRVGSGGGDTLTNPVPIQRFP